MNIRKIFETLVHSPARNHVSPSLAPRIRLHVEGLETRQAPSGMMIGAMVMTVTDPLVMAVQCQQ
jgi:hypothetical protein